MSGDTPAPLDVEAIRARLEAATPGPLLDDGGHPLTSEDGRQIERLTAETTRLRDLVRHQRGPLHDAGLLTDEEYAALAGDHGAVARLEGYDALAARVRELEARESQRTDKLRAELLGLVASLDAIARAHNPKAGCLDGCASWRDDDCDCGYVEAGDDVGAYAREALDAMREALRGDGEGR